uniref:Reverse transcriptase domain-containing protein n=1 Tax=Tanacetum cinerariifolium TaxID=118510 RepID=A0A6L2KZX3_TANCI|nr:hypothetical protein [Tanacetum cinerariifolium]
MIIMPKKRELLSVEYGVNPRDTIQGLKNSSVARIQITQDARADPHLAKSQDAKMRGLVAGQHHGLFKQFKRCYQLLELEWTYT